MKKIKRYDLGYVYCPWGSDSLDIMEHEDGDFVEWKDYKELLNKYETVLKQLEELKKE